MVGPLWNVRSVKRSRQLPGEVVNKQNPTKKLCTQNTRNENQRAVGLMEEREEIRWTDHRDKTLTIVEIPVSRLSRERNFHRK